MTQEKSENTISVVGNKILFFSAKLKLSFLKFYQFFGHRTTLNTQGERSFWILWLFCWISYDIVSKGNPLVNIACLSTSGSNQTSIPVDPSLKQSLKYRKNRKYQVWLKLAPQQKFPYYDRRKILLRIQKTRFQPSKMQWK